MTNAVYPPASPHGVFSYVNRGLARLRHPPSLSYGATRVYGAIGVDVDLDWPTPRLSFVLHIDAKPRLHGSP